MYILGISCYYHDAAATLIKDGVVIAAADEERFTRKKHDSGFPNEAIRFCLESANITIEDVAYVAFYEKPFLKFERILHQHLEMFPRSLKTFVNSLPSWINEKLRVLRIIRKKLKYKGVVLFVPHHVSHAGSAFFPSPFKEAAVVTVDGVGEWSTTTIGSGKDNTVTLTKEINFPHSIGLLYSTITAYLGFSVNNSEYKVMGLAAYGDMNRETNTYYKKLLRVIDLKDDGSYRLDMDYFLYHFKGRMPSKKLCALLGGPVREDSHTLEQHHKDIAAAVQLVTEDVMTKIITHAHKITGCNNLVMSGGVALNSLYNGKILSKTPFKNVWIQPNSSDGGSSLGAALFAYYQILDNERNTDTTREQAYLGPAFTNDEIKSFLTENNITYQTLSGDTEISRTTAKLVSKNMVVGWFQGNMEWGPRALGSRSILANPKNKDAQALLNEKVKHRERFRPFAPAVCEDDANTYFECDATHQEPTDYMLMVYPIKEEYKKQIPSVVHVDGTGRLQTVKRETNHLYYDMIKELGKLSGIPIVINTSFNIRGEPIVCTPADAYRCMMGTGIDCLVIGRYLIKRDENPDDMWDSESLAFD